LLMAAFAFVLFEGQGLEFLLKLKNKTFQECQLLVWGFRYGCVQYSTLQYSTVQMVQGTVWQLGRKTRSLAKGGS